MSLLNSMPRPKIDDWRLMSRCYFSCYTIYSVKNIIIIEGKKSIDNIDQCTITKSVCLWPFLGSNKNY